MLQFDCPGTFLNADMDKLVDVVLCGNLTKLMVTFAPQIFCKYVTLGNRGEVLLYVTLQKVLYG